MMLFINQKTYHGVMVLCLLQIFLIEAAFRNNPQPPTSLRQRLVSIAAASRAAAASQPASSPRLQQSYHQIPNPASLTDSMQTINLNSPSSSTSTNIHRSASLPSLHSQLSAQRAAFNEGHSPARSVGSLHRQAASVLNTAQLQRTIPTFRRLVPNFAKVKIAGRILKNSAIAAAGAGGVITIANSFSKNSENSENSDNINISNGTSTITSTTTTTTQKPERFNPIGVDE